MTHQSPVGERRVVTWSFSRDCTVASRRNARSTTRKDDQAGISARAAFLAERWLGASIRSSGVGSGIEAKWDTVTKYRKSGWPWQYSFRPRTRSARIGQGSIFDAEESIEGPRTAGQQLASSRLAPLVHHLRFSLPGTIRRASRPSFHRHQRWHSAARAWGYGHHLNDWINAPISSSIRHVHCYGIAVDGDQTTKPTITRAYRVSIEGAGHIQTEVLAGWDYIDPIRSPPEM